MSSHLWRYYLENDAEQFQRLLGFLPSSGGGGSTATAGAGAGASASLGKSKSGDVVLTRQMLRETDAVGRTILHLACSSPTGLAFVTALLRHPLVDPSFPDAESGWTAMHRALYYGNISAVREILAHNYSNWNIVKIKDRAGDSPFEVFGGSVYGIEERLELQHAAEANTGEAEDSDEENERGDPTGEYEAMDNGDEVFAFGSNKNITLGFPDQDDRAFPERVSLSRPHRLVLEQARKKFERNPLYSEKTAEELLDAPTLFDPIYVNDIQLSKLHTAILTTDPHSNLFICGFGHGGRLGFGDEQLTQFTFRPLSPPLLPKKKVESVALGLDHTVCVLSGGEVWTWGGNKWGQLGYALQQKTPKEEPIQSVPRQVCNGLKKEIVIGCAASRIHTAVFTSTSLWTFGKNEGQLGILDSSDARTLASQPTPRKVSASFLSGLKILQVAAIDKATAVLLENYELWILAGYGYSKLSFPTERFVGLPNAKNITRYDPRPNFIRKITGGGDTLCALSRMGDVFTLDVEACLKERSEKGGKINWLTHRAWSLRKKHMAAKDVDVGQDGSIIICTESGSVWRRVKRAKNKEAGTNAIASTESGSGRYKFERVPGLTRIIKVRSNKFGAYAAIRKDTEVMKQRLQVTQQQLWEDIGALLSLRGLFVDEEEGAKGDDHDMVGAERGYGPKPRPKGYTRAVKWFMGKNIERELAEFLIRLELAKGGEWDMTVATTKAENIEIPVHKVIMAARSSVLRRLLSEGSGSIDDKLELIAGKGGRLKLLLKDMDLLTVLNFVYYIYVDTVIDLWHQRGTTPAKTQRYKYIRTELASLAAALDLKLLENSVGRMHYPSRSMNRDFAGAFNDPAFAANADIIIELAHNETLHVHSHVMRARCPFFSALYGGRSNGRWLVGRRESGYGKVKVDMKHVEKKVVEMAVSWLYSDWGVEGFDGVKEGVDSRGPDGLDVFLDFVMDVLSVANELMLGRLEMVCQKVLGQYVNTRNAAQLLMAVSACSETGFKDMCLQYICLNLETMLENHLLDDLDEDLMSELDKVVRSNQLMCFPNSRGGKQEKALQEKYPNMLEDSAKEKEALIASYISMSKTHEEGAVLSTSLKGKGYLSELTTAASPLKARKKSSREGKAFSNGPPAMAEPNTSSPSDLIFDMDDEDAEGVPSASGSSAVKISAKPSIGRSGYSTPASSLPKAATWIDSKDKMISPNQLLSTSHSSQNTPRDPQQFFSSASRKPQAPVVESPSRPWGPAAVLHGQKRDMKEIMSQASTSLNSKSGISLGLASPTSTAPKEEKVVNSPFTPTKMSQKERKRQQMAATQPVPATPEKGKSPWQTPNTGPKISLKDVLAQPSVSGSPVTKTPVGPSSRPIQAQVPPPGPGSVGVGRQLFPKQKTEQAPGTSVSSLPSQPPPKGPLQPVRTNKTPVVSCSSFPSLSQSQFQSQSNTRPSYANLNPPPPKISNPSSSSMPTYVEPTLHLSLADIISQEEAQKELIKEHAAKRSLQDIQAEQEFQIWWDRECERVRMETAMAEQAGRGRENRKRRGGRGGRGGGGGGERGRGRGRRGDAGVPGTGVVTPAAAETGRA